MSDKTSKLSKTQAALLQAMRDGAVVHYMPSLGSINPRSYYYLDAPKKRCTQAARALTKKGLAKLDFNARGRGGRLVLVDQK